MQLSYHLFLVFKWSFIYSFLVTHREKEKDKEKTKEKEKPEKKGMQTFFFAVVNIKPFYFEFPFLHSNFSWPCITSFSIYIMIISLEQILKGGISGLKGTKSLMLLNSPYHLMFQKCHVTPPNPGQQFLNCISQQWEYFPRKYLSIL